MEFWFWAAVYGAVFAGFSNFCFKIAARRHYNAELFTLIGGIASVVSVALYVSYSGEAWTGYGWLVPVTVLAGVVASMGGIMKVYALNYIDTTIFFPLFKLLSPLLALIFGLVFYNETHTSMEWLGLLMGLSVPLMLINRIENNRQSNLYLGLILVVLISITSASAAALNKLAIDFDMPVSVTLWYASLGVAFGSMFTVLIKKKFKLSVTELVSHINTGLVVYSVLRALLICVSLGLVLYAYIDGTLGVVQTVHSMYILIPIVLAIMFYNEHWNLQKVVAIILSVAALALLG